MGLASDRVLGGERGDVSPPLLRKDGHNIVCPPQDFVIKIM